MASSRALPSRPSPSSSSSSLPAFSLFLPPPYLLHRPFFSARQKNPCLLSNRKFGSSPKPQQFLSLDPLGATHRTHHCNFSNPNIRTVARLCRSLKVRSNLKLNSPLISPEDSWGIWSALLAIGAFGLWSEKTKIGGMVSGALVSILVGLAASNLGIIPYQAPAYSIVFEFLLPLTVPMLLFRANLNRLVRSAGRLLLAFLLGSVATVVGTVAAYFLVPMRSLGQDSWKIAAALMGSYIGGAVNYIAISEALGISPSIVAAGVAADNVICAIYFMVLFALASKVPCEASSSLTDVAVRGMKSNRESKPQVLSTATAIAASFAICKFVTYFTSRFGIKGGVLPE
ncbi:hypothetical protein Nepgr_029954 [Nepenthes gracilis]|uniref:DUF819 domain-containing protein n=1 Tax=Nepenthes gracilis TaxID=150966 RepID=A0AAD3Y629_NEPGR|nr:hypothetical protein Nepgr_029954 [Nepenthes gracilis]